ncbi:glycosyltransferase family 2 protein [Actinosynnema sp. NPDC050801]|uniref:glycosyltransferase family 2 protein n=1 Tax=unclassified Actinosynnema TaxID=2637065 RepID=UPI00340D1545
MTDESSERDVTVSILVVNWNSAGETASCVEYLRSRGPADRVEFIVVDNASSTSLEPVEQVLGPADKLIVSPVNLGFGAACNLAATVARGQKLLLLNPDARVDAGAVMRMADALDADPTVGCVGIRHVFEDGSLQWSTDDAPTVGREIFFLTPFSDWKPAHLLIGSPRRWSDHTEDLDVDWVNGACMMITRNVWDDVRGFDERFFLFAEELDLCLRIRASDRRVRFLSDPTVVHRLGGSFSHGNARELRLALLNQGMLRYFHKHRSRPAYAVFDIGLRLVALAGIAWSGAAALYERRRGQELPSAVWARLCQGEQGISGRACIRAWWRVLTVRRDAVLRPSSESAA